MKWVYTRVASQCAYGHPVPRGVWALKGRRGWRQYGCGGFVVCERHAKDQYGLEPPTRERDGKALAAGED